MPSVVSSSSNITYRTGAGTVSSSRVNSGGTRSRMLRLQDRRFHHKFPTVCPDEQLLNYFSCALQQDLLLLQGHLFITSNYFAFYSNIFGHKKEILIPILEVIKITKEKTAKIIPNAVGVYTEHEKFVFCSLLSRDTAFRVIQQTWIQSTDAGLGLHEDSESEVSPVLVLMCQGEDSSVSSAISGQLTSDDVSLGMTSETSPLGSTPDGTTSTSVPSPIVISNPPSSITPIHVTQLFKEQILASLRLCRVKKCFHKIENVLFSSSKLPRTSLLFMISTTLIVFLLMSTSILFYRISLVHQRLPETENWYIDSMARYNQATAVINRDLEVEKMILKVQDRIKHLTMIRQALEQLLTTANIYGMVKEPTE